MNIRIYYISKKEANLNSIETKWANVESKQTPDIGQMKIEQYQVSAAIFSIVWKNSNRFSVWYTEEYCSKKYEPPGFEWRYKSLGEFAGSNAGATCPGPTIIASTTNS